MCQDIFPNSQTPMEGDSLAGSHDDDAQADSELQFLLPSHSPQSTGSHWQTASSGPSVTSEEDDHGGGWHVEDVGALHTGDGAIQAIGEGSSAAGNRDVQQGREFGNVGSGLVPVRARGEMHPCFRSSTLCLWSLPEVTSMLKELALSCML